jgi:Phosphotransferase enzyme family
MFGSPDTGGNDLIPGRAAAAALALARERGLDASDPVVLRDLSNLILHLRPAPVVARVATTTGAARDGALAWLERDLAMAGWLHARGVPVVAPASELPPGPHVRDGFAITFWSYAEHEIGQRAGPTEVGSSLRVLHDALGAYPGALPPLGSVLDEAAGLVGRPEAAGVLSERDATWLRLEIERVRPGLEAAAPGARPLHGDAHGGNLLLTPSGLVWSDLEDCCSGPAAWDLACMISSRDAIADPRWTRRALDAYGFSGSPQVLEPFRRARMLQLAAWTAFMAGRHPELGPHVGERLRGLRTGA